MTFKSKLGGALLAAALSATALSGAFAADDTIKIGVLVIAAVPTGIVIMRRRRREKLRRRGIKTYGH